MTEQARPDWLYEGGPVAIERRGNIAIDVVKRFTATRVVLESGAWFPLATLRTRPAGNRFDGGEYLRDANDPRIVKALRVQQAKALAFKIDMAVRTLSPASPGDDFALVAALAEQLVRKVRA